MVRSAWPGEHGLRGEGSEVASSRRAAADGWVGGAVVEIACDGSGFSGSNLLDAATPVFTHASVDLCVEEAVELIQTLRSGFRRLPSPCTGPDGRMVAAGVSCSPPSSS
jgi:hypothetical protein